MPLRGEKALGRFLARRKGGPVDDAPGAPAVIYKRVLQGGRFLIQANLVFVGAFAANKTTLVARLFGAPVFPYGRGFAALDAIAANLKHRRPAPVDGNY